MNLLKLQRLNISTTPRLLSLSNNFSRPSFIEESHFTPNIRVENSLGDISPPVLILVIYFYSSYSLSEKSKLLETFPSGCAASVDLPTGYSGTH